MGKNDDLELVNYACGMATTQKVKEMLWYIQCALEAGEGSFLNDKMFTFLMKKGVDSKVLLNIEA